MAGSPTRRGWKLRQRHGRRPDSPARRSGGLAGALFWLSKRNGQRVSTGRRERRASGPPGGPYPLYFRPWLVVTPRLFIP
jgi:hypothetical protein